MNWLRRFMAGRYGNDQLNNVMLITSILLAIISRLTKLSLLAFLAYVPLAIGIYRMLSKDVSKRQMENYKFSMAVSPVYSWFLRKQKYVKDSKTHRYFKCPNCKVNLRVPRGKGRITITCPKCKTELKRRT